MSEPVDNALAQPSIAFKLGLVKPLIGGGVVGEMRVLQLVVLQIAGCVGQLRAPFLTRGGKFAGERRLDIPDSALLVRRGLRVADRPPNHVCGTKTALGVGTGWG